MTPRQKIILIVTLFAGLAVLLIGFAVYRSIVYSATISITYAPESAVVTLNNKNASKGENRVKPGNYEVKITREGFAEYKTTVEAKEGQTTLVEAVLESNDPSTADWYQEHESDYTLAQSIGDGQADRNYENFIKKFPIAKDLPLNGIYGSYQVFYETADNTKGYAVIVSYQTEAAKKAAIAAIKAKGYKLEDYEVFYQPKITTVNNVAISGIVALSDAGYDKAVVDLAADRLTRAYDTYAGEKVTSIEFLDDLKQSIDDDSDTSTISFTFNEQYKRRLIIYRNGQNSYTISVSAPNGSDSTRIY